MNSQNSITQALLIVLKLFSIINQATLYQCVQEWAEMVVFTFNSLITSYQSGNTTVKILANAVALQLIQILNKNDIAPQYIQLIGQCYRLLEISNFSSLSTAIQQDMSIVIKSPVI